MKNTEALQMLRKLPKSPWLDSVKVEIQTLVWVKATVLLLHAVSQADLEHIVTEGFHTLR